MSCVTKMIVFRTSPWRRSELLLQARARDRVERAERLVHQHHRRVGRERAREADALALAAGELRGVALAVVALGQADEVEQLVDRARGSRCLRPAEQARHGGDVVRDRHVREEPDLLDHVADPAPELGLVELADAAAVDPDVALGEVDEPVDELHRRRLAAARRADEAADLAGGIVSDRSSTAGAARPGYRFVAWSKTISTACRRTLTAP